MENQPLQYYLDKNALGSLSQEEWTTLRQLLQQPENQQLLTAYLDQQLEETARDGVYYPGVTEEVLSQVLKSIKEDGQRVRAIPPTHRVHFLRKWSWAAAAILLVMGISAYFWVLNKKNASAAEALAKADITREIQPGKNGAILTLADGSQVVLDSLGNGVIATQNGMKVVLKNGQLAYGPAGKGNAETAYNTMSTPKGRQFSLLLPDGTRVWLNAESSVRYPITFTGNERRVSITGEAYFEVAKNTKMPFRVNVNDQAEIEVLGTHFNVNAYTGEESLNTTLLEGSVKVSPLPATHSSQVTPPGQEVNSIVLKPGQQVQIHLAALTGTKQYTRHNVSVLNGVDINKVMAWKNGLFNFQDASLEEVMRQLERWYDIEVVYEQGIPAIYFGGKMSRNIKLSDVLTGLAGAGVHFRIEKERRLVVMP